MLFSEHFGEGVEDALVGVGDEGRARAGVDDRHGAARILVERAQDVALRDQADEAAFASTMGSAW